MRVRSWGCILGDWHKDYGGHILLIGVPHGMTGYIGSGKDKEGNECTLYDTTPPPPPGGKLSESMVGALRLILLYDEHWI